jgi:hypothetical protein
MADEFLTIKEAAARLKVTPKTLKNKMAAGILKKGVHYFSPRGLGPRFRWSALLDWLEEKEARPGEASEGKIPMARGYFLGDTLTRENSASIDRKSDELQSKS